MEILRWCKRGVAAAILAVVSLALPASAQVNLISNGDFSNPFATPSKTWNVSNAFVILPTWNQVVPGRATSTIGVNGQLTTDTSAGASPFNGFTLIAGAQYTLAFDFGRGIVAADRSFNVNVARTLAPNLSSLSTSLTATSTTATRFTQNFTAVAGGSSFLSFTTTGGTLGNVFIDNVSLVQIPELNAASAGLSLISLLFGLILIRERRIRPAI